MEKTPLIAGMIILLALVGTTYYITNLDQTYYCEDRNIVSMCFKLSNPTNNISSRCYYNETIPTKYFTCTSGWKPIKDFPEIMNNLTISGKEIIDTSYDTTVTNDMSNFIKSDINLKYGVITLTSSNTGKIAEYSLTSTTESIIDLAMFGKATLYQDGTLFDDTKYLDKIGVISRNGQYSIQVTKDNYVDVPDTYKEQCDVIKGNITNGTEDTQNCYNITATTKKENQPITSWEIYNKQILSAGDYFWKWEGKRKIGEIVDVQPVTNGIPLTEWVWYNSSWSNKKQINIMENLGVTQNNFAVKLNVTYVSSMNVTFTDLRFVNSTETGELSYWIESYATSSSAIVWVKVPTLTASVNTTIYMYYNNTNVATTSNGYNTFTYFDHFDESVLNTTFWTKTGTITMGGSRANISNANEDRIQSVSLFTYPSTAYGLILDSYASFNPKNYFSYGISSLINGAGISTCPATTLTYANGMGVCVSTTWSPYYNTTGRPGVVGYQKVTLFSNTTTTKYYRNDILNMSNNNAQSGSQKLSFMNNDGNLISIDYIIIRNGSIDNPPTATFRGEESPLSMSGSVVNSAGTGIANASVYIYNNLGVLQGNTTSNSTGGWTYATGATFTNWTAVGFNTNNISQGGNAYPFIST